VATPKKSIADYFSGTEGRYMQAKFEKGVATFEVLYVAGSMRADK
jgi:hypothetical protein